MKTRLLLSTFTLWTPLTCPMIFPENIDVIRLEHFETAFKSMPSYLDFYTQNDSIHFRNLKETNTQLKDANEHHFDTENPAIPFETFISLVDSAAAIQASRLFDAQNWIYKNPISGDFFNNELKTPFVPFTKILCNNHDEDMSHILFGDCHGDVFSVLQQVKPHINNKGKIDENKKLIFCGDFTDKGVNGTEVLAFFSWLVYKNQDSDNIILIRGNHEDQDINRKGCLGDELDMKYGKKEPLLSKMPDEEYSRKFINATLRHLHNRLYSSLPVEAIAVNVTKNNDFEIAAKYCHGGDEIGTDPFAMLKDIKLRYQSLPPTKKSFFAYQGIPLAQFFAQTVMQRLNRDDGFIVTDCHYDYTNKKAILTFHHPQDRDCFITHQKDIVLSDNLYITGEGENRALISEIDSTVHVLNRWDKIKSLYPTEIDIKEFLCCVCRETYSNIVEEKAIQYLGQAPKDLGQTSVRDYLLKKDVRDNIQETFEIQIMDNSLFLSNIIPTECRDSNSCWAVYNVRENPNQTYIGHSSIFFGKNLLKKLYGSNAYGFIFRAHQHGDQGPIMEAILTEKGHHALYYGIPIKTLAPGFFNIFGVPDPHQCWPGINKATHITHTPSNGAITVNNIEIENNEFFQSKHPQKIAGQRSDIMHNRGEKLVQLELSENDRTAIEEYLNTYMEEDYINFLNKNYQNLIAKLEDNKIVMQPYYESDTAYYTWKKRAQKIKSFRNIQKGFTAAVLTLILGYIIINKLKAHAQL